MALLTGPRNTPIRDVDFLTYPVGVEAAITLWLGGLCCLDDNRYAYPAQPKTGTTPLTKVPQVIGITDRVVNGQFGENAVNVVGAAMIPSPNNLGSAGAISVEVKRGVFLLDINGTSITYLNVGQLCYAVDDHTVDVSDGGTAGGTVTAGAYTTPGATFSQIQALGFENVVVGSVIVQNSGQTTTYVEGTDYVIDYQAGLISYLTSGAIATGAVALKITFNYGQTRPTRPVVGEIVALEGNLNVPTAASQVWVDVRRQVGPSAF